MMRLAIPVVSALSLVATTPSAAQDTLLWRTVGQWQIRIDKSVDYGCFMLGSYTQGTLLRIGFDQQNRNGYILVGNEAWRSLQIGGRYELVLRFDSAAPWRGNATARTIGSGGMVFLYLPFENSQFLVDLARRVNLTIYYAGNVVTQLPLRGTYAATQELLRCQRAADVARTNPQDPFSGGPQRPPPGGGSPGPTFSPSGPTAGPNAPAPPGGPTAGPGPASPGPGSGPSGSPEPTPGGSGGPTFSPTR